VIVQAPGGPRHGIMTLSSRIDIGAVSREEVDKAGIGAGSGVSTPKRLRRLLASRVSGRSFDDRIGCAILLSALQELTEEQRGRNSAPVWFVFTAQEETGLHGAQVVAESAEAPERVYAIDSFVTSDSPLEDRRIAYAPLGGGFVLRAVDSSGMTPRDAVERVADLARRHEIPVQYGVTLGGNDGSRFVTQGAVNIPLSWPLRYAHTSAEVADLRDVEALAKIVRILLMEELEGARNLRP